MRSSPGQPAEIQITDLAHDGRGVGRLDGKVVFVEGALPGEQVQTSGLRHRGKISETQVASILQASPDRRDPRCPHFAECGGCSLQHLQYQAQLEARQIHLLGQLRRSGIEPVELLQPVSSEEFGYRRRARLVVEKRTRRIGYRRKSSNAVAAVEQCPVLTPSLQSVLPSVAHLVAALKGRIEEVELAETSEGIQLLLHAQSPWRASLDLPAVEGIARVMWLQGKQVRELYSGEFVSAVPGFMQANRQVNQQLVAAALDALQPLEGKNLVDFFCGAGNFTLALAAVGAGIIGYELSASLVEQARRHGLPNADFRCANLFDTRSLASLKKTLADVDAALLDPPRAGALELCRTLASNGPGQLIYVSCHPATFARDAAALVEGGYQLQSLQMFDMFPQTMHCELMACFRRC